MSRGVLHVPLGIFLCVLSLLLCTASPARATEPGVPSGEDFKLSKDVVEIGPWSEVREYVVPFTLGSVPDRAALHLQFGVVRKGWCPRTYRPTTIDLNRKSLASLDFRTFAQGSEKDIRVPVPSGILKVGENVLRIRTGSCQFDVDVMRLNNLTLLQR